MEFRDDSEKVAPAKNSEFERSIDSNQNLPNQMSPIDLLSWLPVNRYSNYVFDNNLRFLRIDDPGIGLLCDLNRKFNFQ